MQNPEISVEIDDKVRKLLGVGVQAAVEQPDDENEDDIIEVD